MPMDNIQGIIDKLSPIERKIIPFLALKFSEIVKKSEMEEVSVVRALKFLESKDILKLKHENKEIVDLGINGIYYKKAGLPERRLLSVLDDKNHLSLEDAQKLSKLSDNEFKASIGTLKSKALVNLSNGKINLSATKTEIAKKSLEEQFLEILPIEKSQLSPEQSFALENLKKRKDIVEIQEQKTTQITLSETGKKLAGMDIKSDLLEELTPEIIKNWNKKGKFRHYDINAKVPEIFGGKKHFVSQSVEYAKKVWTDLGFKEMTGTKTMSSFWNFDALFTAQDHPVREMQDTFFIKDVSAKLPSKEIVKAVKEAHEQGVQGSKGWDYKWNDKEAEKVILRTHTTCLSAQTLASLRNLKDKKGKFFSVGKCFRNETVDWSHGFEFNQTEGIVIDKNANFRHLFGYLKEFFTKMGFSDVKFVPSYFPYTEPSVEIYGFHQGKNTWIEIGGAGILRPEVVVPLLGEYIPVLAWGPGFDRTIMDYYKITDLREFYSNDLNVLRNKKAWIK
jgi:phenylalanyl-tRNA synthetase alpha chain